jgi:hypothetical protein
MIPLKARWFNGGRGTIGLVQVMDDEGEVLYFIGAADGLHEPIDINNIANAGASFPTDIGHTMFGYKKGKSNEQDEKQQPVRRVEERPTKSRGVRPLEGRAGTKTDTKRKSTK